jgi:hypothetical protein
MKKHYLDDKDVRLVANSKENILKIYKKNIK